MATMKPALHDQRWQLHNEEAHDDPHFVKQVWKLVDADGDEHFHEEQFVNVRARTERPPHDVGSS